MTFLFFYTELAGYVLAGMRALSAMGHSVHVVRYPVNAEAPFAISSAGNVTFYERKKFTTRELAELGGRLKPDMLFVSGWADGGYTNALKHLTAIPVRVLALDNPWEGTLRQRLRAAMRWQLRHFTHCWVPGAPQKTYARNLGFSSESIFTGVYAADTQLFSQAGQLKLGLARSNPYPRQFLYVGRYIGQKGLPTLWEAYKTLPAANRWPLVCVGTGPDYEKRPSIVGVTHRGFLQPQELAAELHLYGCFILPSLFEPWAVVVQEMAAAGLPLLLSDKVMARSQFLAEGHNGFYFPSGNPEALLARMKEIMQLSDQELYAMSLRSIELGKALSPQTWANTALEIARNKEP